MNIALLGYGRMGKEIERLAIKRGHTIGLKVTSHTKNIDFSSIDIAIDFSVPHTAVTLIKKALEANIPVVSGTTGWLDNYHSIEEYCSLKKGAFIYASNFSLGVNIFFELNKKLAELMSGFTDYSIDIEEIHHTKKLDAPSGTAIRIAEDIITHSEYTNWKLQEAPNKNTLSIKAKRIADVPGTHSVSYNSSIDTISIVHQAHNRSGFALGAIVAAEWLLGKTGIFSMKDVLNIG